MTLVHRLRLVRFLSAKYHLASFTCILLFTVSVGLFTLHAQTFKDLHDFNCSIDGCDGSSPGIVAQGRDGNLYSTLPDGGTGNGTVYKITSSGTLTAIYNFSYSDGSHPYSGLSLGTDGNFYGATYNGGANAVGTVFKITPAGALTTLHDFTNADGGGAFSGPVQGTKSTFYGAVAAGGAYSVTSSGTFTLLSNPFTEYNNSPMILASDGNLYGTSTNGGANSDGLVYRMDSKGKASVIYTFDSTHGAQPYGPVVQGADGFLYGTTFLGGSHGGGVVFKLSTKGAITVLHEFDNTSTTDGYNPLGGLVAGTDGNFYGITTYGTSGGSAPYGTLFKITETGTYTLLHAFDGTHGANPQTTPVQATSGVIYGEAYAGGAGGNGVFYSFDASIPPFVSLVGFPVGVAGQTVEILGQGFTGTTSVKFGLGSASFSVVSDTYLTATVPSSGTSGIVTVATPGGTLKSKQTFKLVPVINSFTPTSGPVGTQVTITGSGFTGARTVTFGSVKATVFTVNSGTQITATVPSGAITGKIKVTTKGGSATSSGTFTVN